MSLHRLSTDVLILGAGGAGLFAALHAKAAAPSLEVTIAVKGLLGKCGCTRMVQGGYNVALAPGDSIERHFMDTIEGGAWLSDQELAWTLVATAPERVRELENELGCFFDRNADGTVHQKAFAGQTFDRTVHKGDLTGIEIVNRLAEQVWGRGIERLEEHRAIELVKTRDGRAIAGALMIDMRDGAFVFVRATAVLLATGGGPTMYRYHTPSGDKSCDGLAMALRAGLPLRDMEMVQFHPTGLLAGPGTRMTGTVLEEGLRGAGGILLNGAGERFMQRIDPRGERATRDVVSRAIAGEIRAGRASPNGGVWLAMAHLGEGNVRRQFKGMVERCADCGFDLAGGRVEVVPTAHYMMGGVRFGADGSTDLAGLFAAGEDTGGVHGANRLGGNGVANSTVFGGIAGDSLAAWALAHRGSTGGGFDVRGDSGVRGDGSAVRGDPSVRGNGSRVLGGAAESSGRRFDARDDVDEDAIAASIAAHEAPFRTPAGDVYAIREALQDAMWNDAGILRTRSGLERALATLDALDARLARTGVAGGADRAFHLGWHDWLNVQSLVVTSRAIVTAALARESSRGAHFREDCPEPGELATSTFVVVRAGDASARTFAIEHVPVDFTRVAPGQTLLAAA